MNNINNIVSTFTTEEKRLFISYLEKKNKRKDAKNIQLFKLINQKQLSSTDICLAIYSSNKKDAYHALRKRLYHSLIDFIAKTNLEDENSIDMIVIKYVIAARSLLMRKQYIAAFKILNTAETIATEHELFSLLKEIYQTQIQYAHTNSLTDLNDLIQRQYSIKEKQEIEDKLNLVYAVIRKKLNNINYNENTLDFKTILNTTLKQYNIKSSQVLSFKSIYKLSTILSISAFVTNDYLNIEPFLIETYNQTILDYKSVTKQPHYHIQILYIISNTLFRNKKFKKSQQYLHLMHTEMNARKKRHYATFSLKYNLLLALNLNYCDNQMKAISVLEPFLGKKHQDIQSLLDIHLALTMMYIQSKEYEKAKYVFSQFYHTNSWYETKVGKEWIIKKNLMEIILHIELNNIDLVESRLLSFKRQYSSYLKKIQQHRVLSFLKLIETYYKNPSIASTPDFLNMVEKSFEWIDAQQEDIFVMSFYAWLKSKMEQKGLYHTTLNLIKKAQMLIHS